MATVRKTLNQIQKERPTIDSAKQREEITDEMILRWSDEDDLASDAEAVQELRKRLKLSQHEISNLVGIPVGTWRHWEQGRRAPDKAAKALFRILWNEPEAALRALKRDAGAMINVMTFDGIKAVVQYDPEIEMFRGEFIGLNGGADFHAADVAGLRREGALSLKVFLDMCHEKGIAPHKEYSGKFQVRLSPDTHQAIASVAASKGISINQYVQNSVTAALDLENRA